MNSHTPGPWLVSADRDGYEGRVICSSGTVANAVLRQDARLIAAAPDLLALAHQYASECGECAGTRICPDDEPCMDCAEIWRVIERAEGRQ